MNNGLTWRAERGGPYMIYNGGCAAISPVVPHKVRKLEKQRRKQGALAGGKRRTGNYKK